ncbi:GNAT family N-acetyltransferase [Cryobacterium sp. Y50]|uniref:GNAT family N-acetyltransferase n=1 Tax=Cryobacterium sp. Y50 TaxID=2048286 RepID=UPI000CE3DF9D|nr:GNAT family N-acetyltransferase [Cryobacterium sp. Y50]
MKGMAAIASGSLIGQLILAGATPLLSRIYPPESFGAFSVVLAISAIIGPAATLRFESALLLPKHEDDARRLFRLGMLSAVSISGLAVLAIWVADRAAWNVGWEEVDYAPAWVGGMVLASATFSVLSQAALRDRNYATVAKRSVAQSAGIVVGQVAFGALTLSPAGLLGGFLVGRCVGYVPLVRATKSLLARPSSGDYRTILRSYWRFPLVLTPSGLLNALGTQLPMIIIAAWFGVGSAGELGMAQRLVFIPATLLGTSMGEVFGAEMSRRLRLGLGGERQIYLRSSARMGLISVAVVVGILVLAPWFLPFVLGPAWGESGFYAQAMAMSVGAGLIASPMSKVYAIHQSFASIAVDTTRIVFIAVAATGAHFLHLDAVQTTWALYGAQTLNYAVTWIYGLRIVSRADVNYEQKAFMRSPVRVMRQRVYLWTRDAPGANLGSVEVFPIARENVSRVLDFRSAQQVSVFENYLDEGRTGVFGAVGERVVGHAWASSRSDTTATLSRYFRLRPGDTLIHHCHVDESARGQGVYGAMLRALVEKMLADSRVRRIFIDTERSNVPSIRGIEKAGFSFVEEATYIRVGKWLVFRTQKK